MTHWQGHRSQTRKVKEVFPEKEFFSLRIGGMRTFAGMTMELLGIAGPGIRKIVTGEQAPLKESFDHENKKENILRWWDEASESINECWKEIPVSIVHDPIKSFGQYKGTVTSSIFYFINNEIHYHGQGYVYLRSLGVELPAFGG